MEIQGRMMEFIRELIGKKWIKVRVKGYISQSKYTDFGIPQEEVLSVTLFLVAINGILGELGNGVSQGVTNKLDAWATGMGLLFSPSKTVSMTFRKRKE